MFTNGPGNLGSISGRVIPKTRKTVFDTSLCNPQHYKVRIKGKVEYSREWNSAPLHLGVVTIEKGAFWSPSTAVANFTYLHKPASVEEIRYLIFSEILGYKWIAQYRREDKK